MSCAIVVCLALTSCGSDSIQSESSKSSKINSTSQKMLDNCDSVQTVTAVFTHEYTSGNYGAASEALLNWPGSHITQSDKETNLINDINRQISPVLSLMKSGQYDDKAILDFMQTIATYNAFCFDLAFAE